MKFSSQPIPLKRCRTGYHEVLPSNLNFHSLHISSSAPPKEKRSGGSTDTKIQIQDIQRQADHLLFKGQPESPLLYASQEDQEQQVLSSKLKRTIPSYIFKDTNAAPILRTHTDTVHDNSVSPKFKNGYQGNFKVVVASPDIINKIPSLTSSSKDGKCQFSLWSSNTDEILPETVNILKDEIIHTQAVVQKEQLSFSPPVATSLKVSQDLHEQCPLVNYLRKNSFRVTTDNPLYQAQETMALKDDNAQHEMIRVNEEVANDNHLITGKNGDLESCRDHPEKHPSVEHSSNIENEFINSKYNHDLNENKMLPSKGPLSKSSERESGEELLLSPLSTEVVSYESIVTKGASDFSSTPILSLDFVKDPKPVGNLTTFEENILHCKDKMKTNDEHLQDKDEQFCEPNQTLQELETSRQESNTILKESYHDASQKLDEDFQRSEENFHNSNKSINDSGENLHVSDEFSQESDESAHESVEHSYKYSEQFQDPGECLQELDENFQLSGNLPNCNDCSQGSIGNIITFSPLTCIVDNKSVSKCPLSGTSESSFANSPTNVSVIPLKGYTLSLQSLGCNQVGDALNDFDSKDKSIKVTSPNVLCCIEKTKTGLDTTAESLDARREEDDLCILEEHEDFEAPCNMKMKDSGFCKVTYVKVRDALSPKFLETNSVQYEDSSLLGNETSDEGTSYFDTDLDKLANGRNLDDLGNDEQTTQNSKHCCTRHEARRNVITNNKKENSLTISPVPDDNMNKQATLKAKTDSSHCETLNATHQLILEEFNISHSLKCSTSKENIPKSSESYQCCPPVLNCKDWFLNKSVVHSLTTNDCNGRLYHQSKECTGENCFISHDTTTEQVVPDNESVPCKCSLGSDEHTSDDFQIEEMSKLQHRSSSCNVYTWTPLVPMLNDSISQTNSCQFSESSSVVSSLVPPFNKKRSIRVGLSKHQKVKRLHTNIRE